MTQIAYRDWVFECDVEVTHQAYIDIASGGAEACGRNLCMNFVKARPEFYPVELLELFARLGIAYTKEAEAYHIARASSGLHLYGAWFHFVGQIVKHPNAPTTLSDFVSVDFMKKSDLAAKPFANQPLVQVDLSMEVP